MIEDYSFLMGDVLDYSIPRCNGQNYQRTARCEKRFKCKRYIDRNNLGVSAEVWFAPDNPKECDRFIAISGND